MSLAATHAPPAAALVDSSLDAPADDLALLAHLRHELRTPLNHVIGYTEILQEECDAQGLAALQGDLAHVHAAAQRLGRLITDLLDPKSLSVRRRGPGPWPGDGQEEAANAELALAPLSPSVDPGLVSATQPAPGPAHPGGRLLVVDDHPENRQVLCRRLLREGYQPTEAGDGREALTLLAQQPFDLILLDIMMPVLDGYETLRLVKADPELRHLPVIMISANDQIASVARCIELGADDYLPKPFEPVILRARISSCLERKRLRDQEQLALEQLRAEQEKSERLLLTILPKAIADRLKQRPDVVADSFTDVTVMFADIVEFTKLASRMTPTALVTLLNAIFTAFDALAERHGLEKIKTIGDAYMVVGGLPTPQADHALAIARMALDVRTTVAQFHRDDGSPLQVRIGIHTGPVEAGVIGTRKFIYDLWGDTVNVASRMESSGLPGHIQVSAATADLLADTFLLERRGLVDVKGLGEREAFWLLGQRPTSR